MGIAKCRLDIWNPNISDTATNKWITVQTPENQNALISFYLFDKLGNPRRAELVISNRAKNFASASGTFSYTYKDSDGGNAGTVAEQPLRRGVLTDFFTDFQTIRLVDQASNQVMFLGRIHHIEESYEARQGATIKLKAYDYLYELLKISAKGMCDSIEFGTTRTVTDMVKALISLQYKKEKLGLHKVEKVAETNSNSGAVLTSHMIADTEYFPLSTENEYRTNIVTDDSGTALRTRFNEEQYQLPAKRTIKIKDMTKEGILNEILKILQHNPQDGQLATEKFGWDYYLDPNISYGSHADFKGKNLNMDVPPPPSMLNVFERGKRIYQINPSEYGLKVEYPAASTVVTQGHSTDETPNPDTVKYATKPMSVDFDFKRPKEGKYTSVLLKYRKFKRGDDGALIYTEAGENAEVVMDILYVTEISGKYKYEATSGSGYAEAVNSYDFDDYFGILSTDSNNIPEDRPGLLSPEYLDLYDSAGTTKLQDNVARIQYQSHPSLSGATNYGYIIVSELKNDFLNRAAGTYVLKGVGDGAGTNASNVTCKINLGATVPTRGYPRRVWGMDKQKTMSKGVITNPEALRQEVASLLSRSSVEIVDGVFSMSGPPMYYWDGEVATITTVSGVQQLSFRNINGSSSSPVELWRYGFRAGMVIAKMEDDYSAIATTSGGKEIYGYCCGVPLDLSYQVNLTENEDFSVGDAVRCFIPLRAGDTIRVENVLTDVAGNHMITEIEYTEEPNQSTKLKTTGVNEGFGLNTGAYEPSLSGMREESDRRMNVPPGHQVAQWTGLFSAVDNNTVRWQTVAGKAEVKLGDGKVYNIDCATSNNNNTTDASGTDGESTRFGLATPPNAGDATVYYIYVDPNKENVDKGEKFHFYTRPAESPVTGSDSIYEQDGDNIIIGWMKSGATSDDLAEFGVFRDSKPGEGKRNLPSFSHAGSATSALLKKGAQTFTSDLQVQASTWANDLARREVKWHGGEATADTTHANIKLADGDNRTIAYGGDSGDNGNGSYVYHNGTNYDDSPLAAFADNTTYYGFIDFAEDATGNMTLRWTNSHTIPYGDDRILLVMIVVPPDATKGRSPIIIPFGTKSLSINAVAIAANSVTADHVAAGTISATHIVAGGLPGSSLNIDSNTTFASGYDPTEIGTGGQTSAQDNAPSNPNAGDLWIDTNDESTLYRYSGSAWVEFDLGLARATANTGVTNAAAAQSTANTAATNAAAANAELDDIADDAKVTPDEKNIVRRLYNDIVTEYAGILAEGQEYFGNTDSKNTNYTTSYNTLVNYLGALHNSGSIFATSGSPSAMESTTSINRTTWDDNWEDYYTKRQIILNAIARKAKEDGVDVAATKRTTFVDSVANDATGQDGPVAVAVGDVWINGHASSQKVFLCESIAGTKRLIGTNWILRDDAGAINNDTTDINGGRIATQAIVLKAGGGKILETDAATGSGTRILLHNDGIYGYNVSTAQFYLLASDGKAYFGGGAAIADVDGLHILTSSGSGAGDSTSGYLRFHHGTSAANAYSNSMTAALRATSATELTWIYGGASGNFVMNMNAFRLTTVGAINGGVDASNSSNYGFWRPPLMTSAASTGDVLKITGGSGTLASPYSTTFGAVSGGGGSGASDAFKYITLDADSNSYSWTASGTATADGATDTLKFIATSDIAVWRNTANSNEPAFKFTLKTTQGSNHDWTDNNTFTGDFVSIGDTGDTTELRFKETSSGSNYVGFLSPTSISSNVIWTLPNADGNANQVLKTNGSGTLSWVDQTTDTNTTYTGGTGIDLIGTSFNLDLTELTHSTSSLDAEYFICLDAITGNMKKIEHDDIEVNRFKHTTNTYMAYGDTSHGTHTDTNTTYSAGTYLDLSGTTFNVDLTEIDYSTDADIADRFIVQRNDSPYSFYRIPVASVEVSRFDNDAGYTNGAGVANRNAYWTGTNSINDSSFYASSTQLGSSSNRPTYVYSAGLYANGTVKFESLPTTGGSYTLYVGSTGIVRRSSSSSKYKENIEDLTFDTSSIYNLVPRSFKYKDYSEVIHGDEEDLEEETTIVHTGEQSFGFIAEEAHKIFPDLVITNEDGEPDDVQYSLLSVALLVEMKKLKARIEVLEGNG